MSSVIFKSATTTQWQQNAINEYIAHPEFGEVASFFLGWVFLTSLRNAFCSPLLRIYLRRYKRRLSLPPDEIESRPAIPSPFQVKTEGTYTFPSNPTEEQGRERRYTLILLLCLSFMLASLSHFLSLLATTPDDGATACAFVVASGLITSQASRLVGLLVLNLDLQQRKIARWESWVYWLALGVVSALTFVTTALAVGRTTRVNQLDVSICSRKQFLPTALMTSIINVTLGSYVIVRVLSLAKPPRIQFSILQDARIIQAASLIILELLLVVPRVTSTNVLVEFIPFTLGALLVIASFTSYGHTDVTAIRLDGARALSDLPLGPSSTARRMSLTLPEHHLLSVSRPASGSIRRQPSVTVPTYDGSWGTGTASLDSLPGATIHTFVRVPVPPQQVHARNAAPTSPAGGPAPSRHILPSQTLFAARLAQERPDGLRVPPRPTITIDVQASMPTLPYSPSDSPSDGTSSNARSPGSTILGSDIIRTNSRPNKDRTKARSISRTPSGTSPSSRTGSLLVSPVYSSRHRSWVSMRLPLGRDSLPVVYERSLSSVDAHTFGGSPPRSIMENTSLTSPIQEDSPQDIVIPLPPFNGPAAPPMSSGTIRASLVRGPRPSPSAPPVLSPAYSPTRYQSIRRIV